MVAISKEELSKLSLEELDALSALVGVVRHERAIALREDAKSKIIDFARQAGVSIQDLFGFGAADEAKSKRTYTRKADGGGTKAPVAPKFKHPENDTITWSGRGRKPVWFVDYTAKGGKESDLLIK